MRFHFVSNWKIRVYIKNSDANIDRIIEFRPIVKLFLHGGIK